jgi:hypothetical protein
MVRVCAWCRLFLGLKRPVDRWVVTHGICPRCQSHLDVAGVPPDADPPRGILVVAGDPMGLEAAARLIGRSGPPVMCVADRRRSERRRRQVPVAVERRRAVRRTPPPASWADGYVLVDAVLDHEIAALGVV